MHAIVLDGGVKSALSSVRALGRAGVYVICGAERNTALSLHSRFVARRFLYRSPLQEPEGFLEDVERACKDIGEPPVIYAFSDATALLLSRNRKRFSDIARMALPPESSIEIAIDKGETLRLSGTLGIPVPEYIEPKQAEDVDAACERLGFPLVVKPRRSVSYVRGKGVLGRVSFAFSKEEAKEFSEQEKNTSDTYPLLMRYVQGGEYGFEVLAKDGRILRYVAHKRLRSLSPTGGAAVLKETIEPDIRMKKHAEALISSLSWTGVAMIEFKQDEATGEYLLLEINGRFWGSLPLAIFSGCDFPNLYGALSLGRALPEAPADAYRRGIRSRHLLGDIKHLWSVWFRKDRMRARAYPARTSALLSFVGAFFGSRYDVWALSDPLPFFFEAIDKTR